MAECDNAYEVIPAMKSKSHSFNLQARLPTSPYLPAHGGTRDHIQEASLPLPHASSPEMVSFSPNLLFSNQQLKAAMEGSYSLSAPKFRSIELSDFVLKHSNLLPVSVNVIGGFCTVSDVSIACNERLNFHFVKHSKVVVLTDSKGLDQYSVPVNSPLKFGLLFNPLGNEQEAISGYYYRTAGDIIGLRALPAVVCATQNYKGHCAESSVEAGELLVIKAVKSLSFPGRGKVLKVHSLRYGDKQLSEKCSGHFSTRPEDVKLEVSVLLQHSICLPQKALLFANEDMCSSLPPSIVKSPIVLEKIKGETSVIATSSDEDDLESSPLLDISSDVSIQIEVVPLSEEGKSSLIEKTNVVYETYDSSRLQPIMKKPCSRTFDLQTLLYKKTVAGQEMDGIHLVWPTVMHPQALLSLERSQSASGITPTPTNFNHVNDSENRYKALKKSTSEPLASHWHHCLNPTSVPPSTAKDSKHGIVPPQLSPTGDYDYSCLVEELPQTPMPSWFTQNQDSAYSCIEDRKSKEGKEEPLEAARIASGEYIHVIPETQQRKMQLEVTSLRDQFSSLDSRYQLLESHLMQAECEINNITKKLEQAVKSFNQHMETAATEKSAEVEAHLLTMEEKIVRLEEQLSHQATLQDSKEGESQSSVESNKQLLETLDCSQVIGM